MTANIDKSKELILLYEHFISEMREIVDEKIVVLDEVSELLQSIKSVEHRLKQLYTEDADVEIT